MKMVFHFDKLPDIITGKEVRLITAMKQAGGLYYKRNTDDVITVVKALFYHNSNSSRKKSPGSVNSSINMIYKC
jgi:hypothetical protein